MNEYRIKAYAKINLGLDVVRRLENGYHEVKMVMQTVGIYDVLVFQRTAGGIVITTDSGELPTNEDNLIYKAAKLMIEKYHITEGVKIHLEKHIPIAAGMAGGSTDAAATLKGMNRLFDLGCTLKDLMELGVKIGADVPYCVMGGTALAEGIGEKLTPLAPAPDCYVLVAKPDINVSTKYVYEHLDAQEIVKHPDIDGMVEAIAELTGNSGPDGKCAGDSDCQCISHHSEDQRPDEGTGSHQQPDERKRPNGIRHFCRKRHGPQGI